MTDFLKEFGRAIQLVGLTPPETILADGKIHRFASNGDSGDDAGWYVLYGDGLPAGSFGCWRAGLTQKWCAKPDRHMTATERADYRARCDAARQQRDADERQRHAEAAGRAQAIWTHATPAHDHPYLERKQVLPHGIGIDDDNRLIIPVVIDGQISSVQYINEDGDKPFLFGGKTKGGYFTIGGETDTDTILIAEGFATGASLHEAVGLPVVVAFHAAICNPWPKRSAESIRRPRLWSVAITMSIRTANPTPDYSPQLQPRRRSTAPS